MTFSLGSNTKVEINELGIVSRRRRVSELKPGRKGKTGLAIFVIYYVASGEILMGSLRGAMELRHKIWLGRNKT